MFKAVSSRVSFPEMDASILQFWKDNDVFRRTESERPDAPPFMLFEGPPPAHGQPALERGFDSSICSPAVAR